MSELEYTMLNTMRAKDISHILVLEVSENVDDIMARRCTGLRDWDAQKNVFAEEGKRLCDALRQHLPGGLFDALLGAMLYEKATVFHVPHVQEKSL